ncbi:MAG: right-handed parallel beta-helix repeat-containing protein, partial [Planctomycetota bacterium]
MLGKTNQIFKKLVYTGIVASVLLAGTAGKAMSAPDSNSIIVDDIEFYVETDKSIYYLGENVEMLYRLTKLGFPGATILCHQSPPLNLVVEKDGETIWMQVQGWYQVMVDLQLFPNIPVEITSSWDMNDVNGVPVGPGTYDVLGVIYDTIGIPDVGVQITILPIPRTITVGLVAGYDFNTIQAAIDDSNDGDTIIVADGIYTGEGNRDIDFLGKAITLRSANGPENCIIDCNGTNTEPHRGFYFHNNEDANSVLEGFTITNGLAKDNIGQIGGAAGGAIYGNGTKATIQYNHIVGNVALTYNFPSIVRGGGLYDCDGTIQYNIISGNSAVAIDIESMSVGGGLSECDGTIKHNTISNNSADFGGGMEIYFSNPIISGCVFTENIANYSGGGVYNNDGSPTLTNCIYIRNVAMVGAGMYNGYNSSPTVTNCTFRGNSTPTIDIHAPEDLETCGGAMCNYENSSPILSNCTFRNNRAEGGGGIVNYQGCNPMLTNCIFRDNWARFGSGILNYLSSPTLTNCTFNSNDATLGSGMLNLQISSPTLTNCILWDGGDEIQNYGSTITITYSDVQGGSTGIYLDPNSTLNWGVGNIDADPCFTDAVNSDYHLKSQAGRWDPNSQSWVQDAVTSRCIDAGNPGCPLGDEPVPNGNRRNMGAFGGTAEASKSPANWRSIADMTNDWAVDSNDLKVFVDYWLNTGECIPGDLNHNQSTNFADFALLANNWLQSRTGKSVFDFGVATKGPLHMAGNIELEGVNISIESDVYIVSENSNLALEIIGNSSIAGDVFITNPDATVDLQGDLFSIGGETGEAALDHVHTGVDPIAFPVPNPSYFEHYVVEDINLTEITFTNVRIPPNTNPSFGGGVTLTGVVFIETPNMVTFTGSVN